MGDELLISFTMMDDDETSEVAIIGHAIAAEAGKAVAGF
jgi:hypothetical protein